MAKIVTFNLEFSIYKPINLLHVLSIMLLACVQIQQEINLVLMLWPIERNNLALDIISLALLNVCYDILISEKPLRSFKLGVLI